MADIDEARLLGQLIVREVAKEWIRQKRVASGKTLRSLRSEASASPLGIDIDVYADENAGNIERGPRTKRRTYTTSRGVKAVVGREGILQIADWIKQKGIDTGNKSLISMAWAINVEMAKRGGSWNVKSNASRDAIGNVLIRLGPRIERTIADMRVKSVGKKVDNFISALNR